jgi:hypothetical protein
MEINTRMEGYMCSGEDGGTDEVEYLLGEANQRPPADYKPMKLDDLDHVAGRLKIEFIL